MPGEHGSGNCSCADAVAPLDTQNLLPFINAEGISALNERVPRSALALFKPFNERLQETPGCSSADGDHELMIHIPFTTPCKITSIRVIGGENGTSPKHVKLYTNHDTLDFLTVHDTPPTQCVDLVEDYCGVLDYPLKATKFSNVTHLTLYFTETYGADTTHLFYIGLLGLGSGYKRSAVVTVYEARANLSDHDVKSDHLAPSLGL